MRKFVSKIGGQAVLEGVMMRGEKSVATAVRSSDGRIEVETSRLPKEKKWWAKVPVLRGFLSFFFMLWSGSKVLMRSAEVYGEDSGEPSKFELWLAEKGKFSIMDIAIFIGVVLGVAMAIGIFIALPLGIVRALELIPGFKAINHIWRNLIASVLKLFIMMGYLSVVALMKDIHRVYQYHGAEHKVISCYEHGLELNVENARKMPRLHDRCGTSFLVITIFVSIIFTIFLPTFDNYGGFVSFLLRFVTRLALLPVVAGVAYEVLKGLAKFDNKFVRIIKAPGLWFQRLTTREPDDSMLEVSLTAFKTVMEMEADESIPTKRFNIKKEYKLARREVDTLLKGVDEADALADWIFVSLLKVGRSELALQTLIDEESYEKAVDTAKKVKAGEPLQYVLGETEFYGLKFKVNGNVLIPRQDTETLVCEALKAVHDEASVLDVCTGSGAVAVAVAANAKVKMTATDISAEALEVARENAAANGVDVQFIQSDLFASVEGKYDVITANPPYIPTAEIKTLSDFVKKEPLLALDGGADGLDFYRRIAAEAATCLNEGGVLLLEIGSTQAADVSAMLDGYDVATVQDINGQDRVIVARLR